MAHTHRWPDEPIGTCDGCGEPVMAWNADPLVAQPSTGAVMHAACFRADYGAYLDELNERNGGRDGDYRARA